LPSIYINCANQVWGTDLFVLKIKNPEFYHLYGRQAQVTDSTCLALLIKY